MPDVKVEVSIDLNEVYENLDPKQEGQFLKENDLISRGDALDYIIEENVILGDFTRWIKRSTDNGPKDHPAWDNLNNILTPIWSLAPELVILFFEENGYSSVKTSGKEISLLKLVKDGYVEEDMA